MTGIDAFLRRRHVRELRVEKKKIAIKRRYSSCFCAVGKFLPLTGVVQYTLLIARSRRAAPRPSPDSADTSPLAVACIPNIGGHGRGRRIPSNTVHDVPFDPLSFCSFAPLLKCLSYLIFWFSFCFLFWKRANVSSRACKMFIEWQTDSDLKQTNKKTKQKRCGVASRQRRNTSTLEKRLEFMHAAFVYPDSSSFFSSFFFFFFGSPHFVNDRNQIANE